jgi:site-specific recombinase XerD
MRCLVQKGNTYWFQKGVPKELRPAFGGRANYLQNLQTADLRLAKERRDLLDRETTKLFAAAREGKAESDPAAIAAHRGRFWREVLAEQANPQTDEEAEHLDITRDAEETERERLKGRPRRAYEEALLGRVPVDEHLEAYLAAADLAPKTANERRGLVKRFAAWAEGQGLKLHVIDRRAVGRYVSEVIDGMDPTTAKKHLTALRQYWVFLNARGHVEGDENGGPWAGQRPKRRSRRATRGQQDTERPFTEDEIRKLLYSPPAQDPKHREQIIDVLRISLLTGMRMDEALSLWVEDFTEEALIIREGKTAAAARTVPLHPDLKATIARRVKGKGPKDMLFHELRGERDPGDTFGKRFRRYRLKLGVDDKRDDKRRSLVNFHSARRWFITAARHAGHPKETIGEIVGHRPDAKDMTFGVYTKGASEEQRRACVESVRLPPPA